MKNNRTLELKLRIDWSELDLFGHVNNVVFYRYMQSARVRFWEEIALYELYDSKGIGPLLASAGIDFKRPLLYPGHVLIRARPAFIKTTSFGLEYEILDGENRIAALGKDAMVLFDFKANRKLPFTEDLRAEIEKRME